MRAWPLPRRSSPISCSAVSTFIRPRGERARHLSSSVLEQLQGFSAPAAVWEKEILPRRVKGYRPAWLDDVLGQGAWLWRAAGTARDDPRVAFFLRDFDGRPEGDLRIGRALG